ncbi:MAG: OB-fold domain-containing protein [Pseudomonadota bacterium]
MTEQGNKISLDRCKRCEAVFIPPRYACPECGATEFTQSEIDGRGKLLTYTTIRIPPLGFEKEAPYFVGIVELSNGLNLTARLKTEENKEPGMGNDVSFLERKGGGYWFLVGD